MMQQTRKGNTKMEDYLSTMKGYSDNLQLASYPMDMRTSTSYILASLDDEFTLIVCVIRSMNLS